MTEELFKLPEQPDTTTRQKLELARAYLAECEAVIEKSGDEVSAIMLQDRIDARAEVSKLEAKMLAEIRSRQ